MDFEVITDINAGVLLPKGFYGNGVKRGKYGLGIIYSEKDCVCSGTFTTNKVVAHPVIISKETLKSNREKIRCIVVNSGNANCLTKNGYEDALLMIDKVSKNLGIDRNSTLISSTGVIGRKMPMDIILEEIDEVSNLIKNKKCSNENLSKSIMTTDRFPKTIAVRFKINNKVVNIGAICKGAGMICPNMLHATMLCFITTDVIIKPDDLTKSLQNAVDNSFNNTVVDGDMSTNDTVIIMANGLSGVKYEECSEIFDRALNYLCVELSKMIVKDGEGSSKIMEVKVKGCKSKEDSIKSSKAVVKSLLVKTALFGGDPNWGRIISAIGYSGADFDINKVDIMLSDGKLSVYLMKDGIGVADEGTEELKIAEDIMKNDEIKIIVDLKNGDYENTSFGCDLSYDYVKLNSEYTT